MTLSIVIPTLDRGSVLIETIEHLLRQDGAIEILVADQTVRHAPEITDRLIEWDREGAIRWLRLAEPSVPKAMNFGLSNAFGDIVLFLDDDVIPGPGLVAKHADNYQDPAIGGVVGQVLQPWHEGPADTLPPSSRGGIWADLEFPFHGTRRASIANCMAGNFSVRRIAALGTGGFDEGFTGVAYRFETEFVRRFRLQSGLDVIFDPTATIRHLKVARGGTRVHGEHHGNRNPAHLHGQYYLGWCGSKGFERWRYFIWTACRNLISRYHLRHPWTLPATALAQPRALFSAWWAYRDARRDATRPKPLMSDRIQ